jgi:hypothetical protein
MSQSLGAHELTLCSEKGERGNERIAEERVKKESHGRIAKPLVLLYAGSIKAKKLKKAGF